MVTNYEDVLIRTLQGLEDDLEELRALLMRQLDGFEGTLKKLTQELPVWLQLPQSKITNTIKFPKDSSYRGALLGPRATALAAGEIEGFIQTWIGSQGELADLSRISQSNVTKPWERDAELLAMYMDNLEHEAQAVVIAARTSLSIMRDEILAELEEQRRQDTEALEQLVSVGDLEQGNQARKEIAELWEEQRQRASTFLQRWEKIERHVEFGLDLTESGLDTLRELLDNAEAGLLHAYPPKSEPELLEEPEEDTSSVAIDDDDDALDFDPYGPQEEPVKEDTGPSLFEDSSPEIIPPAAAAQSSRKLNEDFFKSDEVNDDLVFADESNLDGPMIDFGDDDPADSKASHQLFSTTLHSSTASSPLSSSPYEIFLGDDSESSTHSEPAQLDPLARPARSPETPHRQTPVPASASHPRMSLADEEFDAPVQASPAATLPYNFTDEPSEAMAQAPKEKQTEINIIETHDQEVSATAPMLGFMQEESEPEVHPDVDVLDTPTMPIRERREQEEQPTLPPGELTPTAPEFEAEEIETLELARDPETLPRISHTGEISEPAIIEEYDIDEGSAYTEEISEPLEVHDIEEPVAHEEIQPDIAPDSEPEIDDEDVEIEPIARPVRSVSVPELHEISWQAEAHRRRRAQGAVSTMERALAVGLPLLLIIILVIQAALSSSPEGNLLGSSSLVRGIAFGACIWLVIGPLVFLRWKFGWKGSMPVPYRDQVLLDDAELIIEHQTLEIGDQTLHIDDLQELSLERWRNAESGEQGLLLFLVSKKGGKPIKVVCSQLEDLEREGLLAEGLPWTEPQEWGTWKVSALSMSQIYQWSTPR